jgi:hypothetical protein
LIVSLGGYGPAAPLVGSFFVLGLIAAPFLPETKGKRRRPISIRHSRLRGNDDSI